MDGLIHIDITEEQLSTILIALEIFDERHRCNPGDAADVIRARIASVKHTLEDASCDWGHHD